MGNPLLPGTKSKMLPDTDFTHQQYYEVGRAQLSAVHSHSVFVGCPMCPFSKAEAASADQIDNVTEF